MVTKWLLWVNNGHIVGEQWLPQANNGYCGSTIVNYGKSVHLTLFSK